MRLWLLRHGQATAYVARDDHLRPLTERGRREARAAAVWLPSSLDRVLCSPYVRAQQTAEEVLAVLAARQPACRPPLLTIDGVTPDDDPRLALNQLAGHAGEDILLVCHQPIIGALAGLLLHGNLQQPQGFNTGSLLCLEAELPLAGLMTLRAAHHPDLH